MPPKFHRRPRWPLVGLALLAAPHALAQDAARGAQLYMRLPSDGRSCVACHGPDPGQNHNNILRAADNPAALTQVLNTVSAMGFLRAQLADGDIADMAAFLGSVVRLNSASAPLRLWPVTQEFGTAPVAQPSATQTLQLENRGSSALPLLAIASTQPALGVTHDCPPLLGAGARCSIRATLTPPTSGLQRAAVRVQTASGEFFAGASGYGSRDAVSVLRWRGDTTRLAFDPPAPDAAVRQTLVLDNPGVLPVVLGTTSVVGPQASQFRRESGCEPGSVLQAGTSCTLVVAHTASRLPLAQATLQLRGDGGNPASVALEATLPATAPTEPGPTALPVESGGGCSVGPPGSQHRDISLAAWLLLAAAWLSCRSGRRRSS